MDGVHKNFINVDIGANVNDESLKVATGDNATIQIISTLASSESGNEQISQAFSVQLYDLDDPDMTSSPYVVSFIKHSHEAEFD